MLLQFYSILIWTVFVTQIVSFKNDFDYIYHYESNFEHHSTNISLNFSSKINVLVQKNDHLVAIKILSVDGNFGFKKQQIQNLLEFPFGFEQKNDAVTDQMLVDPNDSQESIWFKKSILSLFDFGIDKGKQDAFYGRCDTITQILSNNSNSLHLKKKKSNCVNNVRLNGQYIRDQKILNSKVDRNIETEFKIVDNVLKSSLNVENVTILNEFNPKISHFIKIRNLLILNSIEKTINKINLDNVTVKRDRKNLISETQNYNFKISDLFHDSEEKTNSEKKFEKEIKKIIKSLKLGTVETSETFLDTIKQIRKYLRSNSKLLDKIFNDSIKKEKYFKFLLEAYLSSGVDQALSSISKALNIDNLKTDDRLLNIKESKFIEEFLFSCSLMSHQSLKANQLIRIVNSNWNKLTNFDIKEKTMLALGSHSDQEFKFEIKNQTSQCKSESCKITLIESAKNSKSNLVEELVLNNINSNCSKQPLVCLISIKALDYLDIEKRNDIFYLLFEIFSTNSLDIGLRVEALNVLVDKYSSLLINSEAVFQNFMFTIQLEIKKYLKTNEFLIYTRKLIFNNENLKKKLFDYLNNRSGFSLFDIFVQNGVSNSMNSLVKSYPSGDLTYNLNQLMSEEGYLKNFDFSLSFKQNDSSKLDFLKIELYADNLGSFSSKLNGKKKEKKDPVSYLHLSIMGQKLKIVELFRGYASMISLLWSLPTSPKSLFNANFLVNDQLEYIFLSNGMSIRIENIGTLGIDIEGVTDVSLWNQYAKIKLKTRASFVNEQNLILINNFIILNNVQNNLKGQFLVNFDMNIDFGNDPYKLCVKLSKEKINIWESIKALNGEKKILQEIRKHMPIQGSNFMFSRETVKFC